MNDRHPSRAVLADVPAIVTPDGGPATIVRDGETERMATEERFADAIAEGLRAGLKGMGGRRDERASGLAGELTRGAS